MALWTPADLANSKAWFVSDNPSNTLVSGELSVIADKSGGAFHATALSAATRAAMPNTLNSRSVWRSASGKTGAFNLASGANALSNSAPGLTIFAVQRMNTPTSVSDNVIAHFSSGTGSGSRFTLSRANGSAGGVDLGTRRLDSDGYVGLADNTNWGSGWRIVGGVCNYSGGSASISLDGTITSSGSMAWSGGAGNTSATNSVVSAIGHYDSGLDAGWFDQDVAEIVMIRGALTTTERQSLEGYLAWQWGLQGNLPSGHPYKSAAPTTGSTVASADAAITVDWVGSFASQKFLSGAHDLSGVGTAAWDSAKILSGSAVLHNSGETDLFIGTGVGAGVAALTGNDTTAFVGNTIVGAVWAAVNDLAASFDSNAVASAAGDMAVSVDISALFVGTGLAGSVAAIDGVNDLQGLGGSIVAADFAIDGLVDLFGAPTAIFTATAAAVLQLVLDAQGASVSLPSGAGPAGLLRVMRRTATPRVMQRPSIPRKMTR